MPLSDDLANIPQDPRNPLTPEKVQLGKLLYHETGIALAPMQEVGKGTYSCASCHFASAGFQAGRWQGIGEGGSGMGINGEGRIPMNSMYTGEELDVQPLRSPSAMNGAWQDVMLWNGQFGSAGTNNGTDPYWTPGTPIETNELGYEGLEIQAIAGLKVHRMLINADIVDTLGYKAMFDFAFSDVATEERYTREYAGLAIAAYERTLLANQSPFQKWLRGDINALNRTELEGALVFFDAAKGNCTTCHSGPALNSISFHALGMKDFNQIEEETHKTPNDDPAYLGRGGFTGNDADMYKFKTPQLYNLADSPFYGHGASFHSIKDVVNYKNQATKENDRVPSSQLASEFTPLGLSDSEVEALATFLETALHDPKLDRYVPESLPSGNCFPFNDPVAQVDLGCN